jgi:hypothetical protein
MSRARTQEQIVLVLPGGIFSRYLSRRKVSAFVRFTVVTASTAVALALFSRIAAAIRAGPMCPTARERL